MKLFENKEIVDSRKVNYMFETTDKEGRPALWAARLGIIANLPGSIEEGVFVQPETDAEDEMIISSAVVLMDFIHVFGHSGNRFLFTGILEGAETEQGVRFYDAERMIEVHVWPRRKPALITIYHFNSNMEYRIRVVPNFR